MKTVALRVRAGEKRLVLWDFLAEHLAVSRRKAKAFLDARDVFVNERRIWMARHRLRPGDTVEVIRRDVREAPAPVRLPVLYRDSTYLVVDKPPGLLTNGQGSVEDRLRAELDLPALAAVHRLDRDTSGCLLTALSREAFDAAVRLFRARAPRKQYHAIVQGRVAAPELTVTLPLEGQRAVTRMKKLDGNADATHLLVQIETGRTHQIRKHLAGLGHPVLGDREYGLRAASSQTARELRRHMLHASALGFVNPLDGVKIRVSAPLPPDFKRCLRSLRLT